MNINNVVLVRVMNNLPLNGELVPSCEGERLVYDKKSDFYFLIKKLVKQDLEKQLGRKINEYNSTDDKLLKDILKHYLVLTGDYYTSTLSFSLNGMVPNDINNDFSSMKIAVIDPIKNHINDDFVTVETIDTTIKGRIKVSNEAILLIERNFYISLSKDIKNNINSYYKLKLFDGSLRDAVNSTLIENNYPLLLLVQKREVLNIEECQHRQSMLEFEDEFANTVGASRLRLNYLTYMYTPSGIEDVDKIAHDKIKEELPNTLKVEEYYRNQLYTFLLNKLRQFNIEISEKDKYYLFTEYQESKKVLEKITSCLIESYGGIKNFNSLIQEYNQYVINNYLTNEQIVALSKKTNKHK